MLRSSCESQKIVNRMGNAARRFSSFSWHISPKARAYVFAFIVSFCENFLLGFSI